MPSGKLRLIIKKKPDPIVTANSAIISVREENNTQDVTFTYQNLAAATLTTNQILYQEGLPNDPSSTYVVIGSQSNQNITTSPGSFELHIVSNGMAAQLDKVIAITIGANTFNVSIDFRSRPDTVDIIKETPSYVQPIIITKQDILDHCSDFDGDAIIEWALDCFGNTDFVYNGAPYVPGTFIPLNVIDANGFSYVPVNNPLGYTIEYPHKVKDSTGLITKLT